jgi:hypothetical protein
MKIFTLILVMLSWCIIPSAYAQDKSEQVKVYSPQEDSYEMINLIDLLGEWRNISSVTPTSIRSRAPESFVSINSGNRVIVKDVWVEDYTNKLRNCTWFIVDSNLVLLSPDLGKVQLDIVKVGKSRYYEFMLNQVTYRKLVNRSSKKSDTI